MTNPSCLQTSLVYAEVRLAHRDKAKSIHRNGDKVLRCVESCTNCANEASAII